MAERVGRGREALPDMASKGEEALPGGLGGVERPALRAG